MASRTKLIGVQEYDKDGGLDWYVHGACLEWFDRRSMQLKATGLSDSVIRSVCRQEILCKFEKALEFAIPFREKEYL